MNINRYEKDLDALITKGELLLLAMQHECSPEEFERGATKSWGDKADEMVKALPSFTGEYQSWYSEAMALIRQLLPDRYSDFMRYYEKPKTRKSITYENYKIEDYLQSLRVTIGINKVVSPDAAIPLFRQQLSLVKATKQRFRSSLFDIRRLAQANLFDTELEAAEELATHKFTRAAGVLASVVLERHLKEVCGNRGIKLRKKAPKILDFNDALKQATVLDIPKWRSIQHLNDLRNLCAHDKNSEPTDAQIKDLITGVARVTKTIF